MRVAAYKKVWLFVFKDEFYLRHVMSWIAPDVGHVDFDVLYVKEEVLGVLHSHDVAVDVAVHGAQRFEVAQGFGGLNAADVASVPQLVNVFEEVEELWHERTMCIG